MNGTRNDTIALSFRDRVILSIDWLVLATEQAETTINVGDVLDAVHLHTTGQCESKCTSDRCCDTQRLFRQVRAILLALQARS